MLRFSKYGVQVSHTFVSGWSASTACLFAIHDNAVGFVVRSVNASFDGRTGNDFAIAVDVIVPLAEFLQRAVLEGPLIIENELLAVIRSDGNKGNFFVFPKNLRIKENTRQRKKRKPSSLDT